MKVAGFIYFGVFIFAYIFIGAYGLMWTKYNKERASKLYFLHGVSSLLLMIVLWIGYLIFRGDKVAGIMSFKLFYIYVGLDALISIITWYRLNPYFKAVLNEYGETITYKLPSPELSKFDRFLYGFFKPIYNVLLLAWQIMFTYFSMTLLINFVSSVV